MKIAANGINSYTYKTVKSNGFSTLLADVAVVLFFAQPFITWVFSFFLSGLSGYIVLFLTYVPVMLILCVRRGKRFPYDFFIIWTAILLFFLITYMIHPEYSDVYRKEYYGVWDYVIKPTNGLYAYLFLRLIDDPKKILKCLRVSAVMVYVYYAYVLYRAVTVGYWEMDWNGRIIRTSYSLEYGYDLLLYVLVFMYCAFKHKKIVDWILGAVGVFMIMGAGSRGPILDIIIFVTVYILVEMNNKRYKGVYIFPLIALMVSILLFYIPILDFLSKMLSRFGLQSRFIQMMLTGGIADDNGRMQIWQHAIQMIKNNPLGYGAMGSRHEIVNVIFVGHPHNIILEFMIDYGVVLGSLFLIGLIISIIRCLRAPIESEWKGLIIIFVGVSSQLLLSGTYWHRPAIWGLLALLVNIRLSGQNSHNRIRLRLRSRNLST